MGNYGDQGGNGDTIGDGYADGCPGDNARCLGIDEAKTGYLFGTGAGSTAVDRGTGRQDENKGDCGKKRRYST
jgi:hypothetical protein